MIVEEKKLFQCGPVQYSIRRQYIDGIERRAVYICRTFPVADGSESGYHYENDFQERHITDFDYNDNEKLEKQLQNAFGIYA